MKRLVHHSINVQFNFNEEEKRMVLLFSDFLRRLFRRLRETSICKRYYLTLFTSPLSFSHVLRYYRFCLGQKICLCLLCMPDLFKPNRADRNALIRFHLVAAVSTGRNLTLRMKIILLQLVDDE